MFNKRTIELLVGIFILAGGLSLVILALKVSGLNTYTTKDYFVITAIFDNIGDLKVRAPITLSGVRIGEVSGVEIDSSTFKAKVEMRISNSQNQLPSDTTAKILTAGIIGANYVELIPGYANDNIKAGDQIIDTQPAIVLENLVSKLLYSLAGDKKK